MIALSVSVGLGCAPCALPCQPMRVGASSGLLSAPPPSHFCFCATLPTQVVARLLGEAEHVRGRRSWRAASSGPSTANGSSPVFKPSHASDGGPSVLDEEAALLLPGAGTQTSTGGTF